jgi:uncharacterized protein (DUF2384 family)
MESMQFPEAVRWLDTPHDELEGRTPAEVIRAGEMARVNELVSSKVGL